MEIGFTEKENIFAMLEEDFYCFFKGCSFHDFFTEAGLCKKGYSYENGAVKYCIFHECFGDFVVKFTTEAFDYCEREYTNYLAAVNAGLDYFFPYTDFLGEINGVKFFIQEYAECDNEAISSIWYDSLREDCVSEEDEDEDIINEKIWNMIYDLEDDQRVLYCFGNEEKLIDFLNEYCINDLHEGNFGYIGERLVIIDFSGYGNRAREREF